MHLLSHCRVVDSLRGEDGECSLSTTFRYERLDTAFRPRELPCGRYMCRLLVFILGTSHKSDFPGGCRDWRQKLVAQLPLDTCLLLRRRKLSYDVMGIAGC